MLSRKEQLKVLIETLEKVDKATKWNDLKEISPLKENVGLPNSSLPTANSYRSVMSSKTYEKIFARDKQEVVFYSLKDNYKQEFDNLFKEND